MTQETNNQQPSNDQIVKAIESLATQIDIQTTSINNLTNSLNNLFTKLNSTNQNDQQPNRVGKIIDRQINKLSSFYKIVVLLVVLIVGLGATFYFNP